MPSFKIIGLMVLEKKIFKAFTIYGHGGHFGLVTWTIYINFRSPFPRRLQKTFEIVDDDDDDNDDDDRRRRMGTL